MSTFLEIRNANIWRGEEATRLVFENLNLAFREGESVAILGPNGAGKSTLLKVLAGELRPEFHGMMVCELFGESRWILDDLRARIGVIMPEHVRRIEEDEIALDAVLASFRGAFGRDRWMRFSRAEKSAALDAMARMGIAGLADRYFGELSSGEKRRVIIARALVHNPGVIVLDEPSTALDFAGSAHLAAGLRNLLKTGHTLVWVTHHPGEIPPEIQRVILLKDGRVFADGQKKQVLTAANLTALFGIDLALRWSAGWCDVRPA